MNQIHVTLAYAESDKQQFFKEMVVPIDSTVLAVIMASGVCDRFPAIDLSVNPVGIFNQVVTLETIVQAGDRVEIYRPLIFDPKALRRQRAKGQVHHAQSLPDDPSHQKTP